MSLKISDLAALNTVTIGQNGISGRLDTYGDGYFGKQDYSVQAIQKVLTLRADAVSGVYAVNSYRFYTTPGALDSAQKLSIRAEYNGSESSDLMTILGSGNVGIGNSAPGSRLYVASAITYGVYGPNNATIVAANTTTDGTSGYISLFGHSGNTTTPYQYGGIGGGKTTSVGDGNYGGYLSLWTTSGGENGQANSASYERMRVTSAGSVIIGGTTPRAKLDVEGYTSFVSISAAINSEATTADQQLAGIDFRKHYALAIGASVRLLQSGGVNNYSPSHLAFYTNDGTTSFGNVPPERMRIASSGNILINTQTDAGYKLNVNGNSLLSGYSKAYTGILNSDNYFEKVFSDGISFTHGVANSAADIRFGNTSFWGYIEIEITATFSNQNSAGKLTKAFAVGTNPNGYIYNDQGRVVDAMGSIADNIAIGDFSWDSANTTFRIPISHIVNTGNNYTVKVRMFTHSSGAWAVFNAISIGPKYTLAALPKPYPYYNDRLGVGTASPTYPLTIEKSDEYSFSYQRPISTCKKWAIGSDNSTTYLRNITDGITAYTITNGGNVLIGTTTDTGYKLEVNGNVKATGFFNSSDNRLKDLVDYEYDASSIKPITYFWKDLRDNKKHIGYSAQEVQKVMPDAVNEGEDGMLSVNYIEVLVAKIAELENRIKQLEK